MNTEQFVEDFVNKNPHPDYERQWPAMRPDLRSIVRVIEEFKIKTVLELGTWEGYTTLMMSELVDSIITVDIHKDFSIYYSHAYHNLRPKEFYGHFFVEAKKENVKQVFSSTHDITKELGDFDMVFIDANHEYDWVKHDTKKASEFNPKVLVWHDYGSEPGVIRYIDELKATGLNIKHGEQLVCYLELTDEARRIINGQ